MPIFTLNNVHVQIPVTFPEDNENLPFEIRSQLYCAKECWRTAYKNLIDYLALGTAESQENSRVYFDQSSIQMNKYISHAEISDEDRQKIETIKNETLSYVRQLF